MLRDKGYGATVLRDMGATSRRNRVSGRFGDLLEGLRRDVASAATSPFRHAPYPLARSLEYRGDPGLFGPGSVSWRVIGDPASFIGGVRALLVQAAHPEVVAAPSGAGRIETYTVVHGRDGTPEKGYVIGRLEDQRRFVAVLPRERELLDAMERAEQVGRRGVLSADGGVFVPGA